MEAGVYVEDIAGNAGSIVREEECSCIANLIDSDGSPKRGNVFHFFEKLAEIFNSAGS